jgi:hypothetical protein
MGLFSKLDACGSKNSRVDPGGRKKKRIEEDETRCPQAGRRQESDHSPVKSARSGRCELWLYELTDNTAFS